MRAGWGMRILVTGGAGYIGSHAVLELLRAGHPVVVVDSLVNSQRESLYRVAALAGVATVPFVQADIRDRAAMHALFADYPDIGVVLHFAGLKAVGESVQQPLRYYDNNVAGTLVLCEAMAEAGVRRIVFSSSATVYGDAPQMPVTEDTPLAPTNPYGHSKRAVEALLTDLAGADPGWSVILLRYFNPVGADASGCIGEDPQGVPANLLPYISQVAVGRLPEVQVFGDDYHTPDGTGIRDYIHVTDLALGHLASLAALRPGVQAFNLGTGQGHSVLEMIRVFEQVSGRRIPFRITARRAGDVAVSYADVARARRQLGWQAQRDLTAMVADAWRWQQGNPQGFAAGDGTT